MSDWKRRALLIALIAVILALMGFIYASQDIAFEIVGNNTDLCDYNHTSNICNGSRQNNTVYWANDSAIVLNIFAHANSAAQTGGVFIYRNGVLYAPQSGRPLAVPEETWRDPGSVIIPKGWNYSAVIFNAHHFEWREDQILSGRNGTLSINMTGTTGCTGNCSFNNITVNSLGKNNTADTYASYINLRSPLKSRLPDGTQEAYIDINDGSYFELKASNITSGVSGSIFGNPDRFQMIVGDGKSSDISLYPNRSEIIINASREYIFNLTHFDMGGANLTNCSNCGTGTDNTKVNKTGDNLTGMLFINGSSIDKLMFHYVVPLNTTWVNVSGLNITRDGFYDLTTQFTCRKTVNNFNLYVNNDVNGSNYTRQFVYADNTVTISARQNDAGISACNIGLSSTGKQRIILDAYGKTHYISEVGLMTGSSLVFFNGMYSYDRQITNITTLNLYSDVSDGIGYGSEIWIYRS